jgi:hypothetical protein
MSGIVGRILDPIARSAAQRAARQIALASPGPRRPSIGNENNDANDFDEHPDVEKDQDQVDFDGNVGDEREPEQRQQSEDEAPPRISTNFPARIAGTPYPLRVGCLLKGLFHLLTSSCRQKVNCRRFPRHPNARSSLRRP